MQVGILLYNNQVVGTVKFEAGRYDSDYSHYELLRTGIETQSSKLSSYLFYPRPEVNPSRSVYDNYGYYPYDGRVPMSVHMNHGQPLRNRVCWSHKYGDYTCYELNDGTIAYTTNYELKNRFYFEYGYNPWSISDSRKILQHLKNKYNSRDQGWWDLCMDLCSDVFLNVPIYILTSICENICLIFCMIILISLIIGGFMYFITEFEIRRRSI